MPEKIGIVIPYRFVPPRNGGHHAAFGFCEAMAKRRDVVVVSTTNNADQALFRLEKLFQDRFYKYFSPVVKWRLWQFFRKEGVQTCIIQQPFFGLIALPVCRLLGITFIVYAHNIEFQRFKTIGKWWWPLLYPIERLMYRSADRILFISPDDREAAIPVFGLTPNHCTVIPYGTRRNTMPTDRENSRQKIISQHGLKPNEFLILFFGPQSYRPNLEAVQQIVYDIHPVLQREAGFSYRILICGGGLPERFNRLEDIPGVDYLGFVPEIEHYIKSADVVLNPINTGGGVKTKIIEAIALGTTVLSSETGAKGVNARACGEKLITVPDQDAEAFVREIITLQQRPHAVTPQRFYEFYNWDAIVENYHAAAKPDKGLL